MRLLPAEKFVVTLILVLAALDLALLSYKHVAIDIPGYISALMTGGVAVAVGQFYRRFRHNEGIALAATAAGLFIIFSIVGSVFNYLLLPIVQQPVDGALAAFDEALGFSWLGFAAWTAGHPWLSAAYRFVYMSSMPQLIAVILILGFSKRAADLHLFLLTGLIGALLTISWWAFFPSFGATAFYSVPQDLLTDMPIIVGPEYGAELKRLAAQGVSYISPKDVLGLIGFPSFHTVMSLMSVWFMARFRLALPVFVVINALMLPAIIVQGGHHLADVLGGAAAFAASLAFCTWIMSKINLRPQPHWTAETAPA